MISEYQHKKGGMCSVTIALCLKVELHKDIHQRDLAIAEAEKKKLQLQKLHETNKQLLQEVAHSQYKPI